MPAARAIRTINPMKLKLYSFCRTGAWLVLGFMTVAAAASDATIPEMDFDRGLPPVRALIERFQQDRDSLRHIWLEEGDESAVRRWRRFLVTWQERLGEVDFDALDPDGRIDWILFHEQLGFERRELKRRQERVTGLAELLPFDAAISVLAQDLRRMRWVKGEAAAETVNSLAKQVAESREAVSANLDAAGDAPAYPQTLAWRAVGRLGELRRSLRLWREFYEGYDPLFTWWVPEPADALDKALDDYAGFLREKVAGVAKDDEDPVIGDPIGRDALLDALRHEFIACTPEELIAIAGKEFAWCEAEARKAADELGFGDDWPRTLDHVKSLHVGPGRQPRLIRQQAREAIRFIEERSLLTIPPLAKESWRMEMMSPQRQKVNPYFTGGSTISVSFPTADMEHADKLMSLRGNNEHFCRAVVHHELIPGHHLQLFMADRYQPHRRIFTTPFLLEGWALYWEMRFWDLGYARSAEDRVGMLFWRMHRCARIIFSLKFHLGEMTAQEAIDFLVERVGHERNNATAEVRRSVGGEYSPLYQAAYMLGGLQLRALHGEQVASGRMTEREFHDAVLRENAIPIELIRARLSGAEIPADFQAAWRFYGDVE